MKKTILAIFLLLSNAAQSQTPVINLTTFATGITRPIEVLNCGDDRVFIVRQAGVILIYDTAGVPNATPFLDITSIVYDTGNERGLLGMAFDLDYKNNGYFYVNYTNNSSTHNTIISRFTVSATDSNAADASSELIIKEIYQPFSNHNGGCIRFGPDGYLYIGMGDGGSAGDPGNRSQNLHNLLGKMLRLDVHGVLPFEIPSTNPYAADTTNGSPEIWSYGVRNPWRFNFDDVTGHLWIADVGQDDWEEIDFEPYGSPGNLNYGWRCKEASFNYNTSQCAGITNFTLPIWEYSHSQGCSVSGGLVYRCPDNAAMWGRYLFADYCSGEIWSLIENGQPFFDCDTLLDFTNNTIASFGEDKWGRIYVCGEGNSTVYRLADTSTACNPVAYIQHLGDSLEVCVGGLISAYEFPGFQYGWTYNGVNVNSTNASIPEIGSGYYQLMVTQGSCTVVSDSVFVSVVVVSPVISGLLGTYAQGTLAVTLTGTPSGGVFSGAGVSGNIFDPTIAGVGVHEIYYTYTNELGCSATDTAITSIVSGINELPSITSLVVYPNPTTGNFIIQLHAFRNEKLKLTIMDLAGRKLEQRNFEMNIGENKIPLSVNLSEGVYIMQWQCSAVIGNERIIIHK